jgi:FkbM family methyltransferase
MAVKKAFISLLLAIAGRRMLWRAGRALYMQARAETWGGIQNDGEQSIQRELMRACATYVERPVVFDVGANIGDWTASLLGIAEGHGLAKQLEVHCFEPISSTYSLLSQRFGGGRHGARVMLVPKACSSKAGVTQMFMVADGAGTNSMYKDSLSQDGQPVQVEMTTVDTYCAENNVDVIHYLKCDTEGHDLEVMHGAMRMFYEQKIMAFQFEYNHRWVSSRNFLIDVFECVDGLPYRIGKVTTDGVELYDAWHPELERFFDGNYLVIHDSVLSWFTTRTGGFDASNTYVAHFFSRGMGRGAGALD